MIATAVALVVIAAVLFGVATVSGSLVPLYGSITASVMALVVVSAASLRHHLRHGRDRW